MFTQASLSVVCILLITASAGGQTVWYVDDDDCPGPGKGTEADPFCKIQHGIDAAVDGDEVVVADGTYTGFGNRNLSFLGKAITLRSAHGAATTTIDCEHMDRGFHFHNSETPDSILDGFRIINGYSEGHGEAAGIYFDYSSPTVRNCDIRYNSLNGIQWHHSNATVSNCIIAE